MRYDLERLAKYPEGSTAFPSGYTTEVECNEKAARELDMSQPRQYAVDVANADHFAEVKKAFETLSRDVNGNHGMALARLFADEHPELQDMWYRSLNAGMALCHREIRMTIENINWQFEPNAIDGRVRPDVVNFIVGRKVW